MRGYIVTLLCTSIGWLLCAFKIITLDTQIIITVIGLVSQQIIYSKKG